MRGLRKLDELGILYGTYKEGRGRYVRCGGVNKHRTEERHKICTVQADVKWTAQNFGGQNRNEIQQDY